MPTNAAMIAANAERFATARIKPEWQTSIDKTARHLTAADSKAWFVAEEKRSDSMANILEVFIRTCSLETRADGAPAFRTMSQREALGRVLECYLASERLSFSGK
jgi:hypothetical protein